MPSLARKFLLGVCFLIVVLSYLGVALHFERVAESDPDRYLHMALAKKTSETGRIIKLPQVENLGWDLRFIEKNYLFTQITSYAFKLGNESLVILVGKFFTVLVAIFFLINLQSYSAQIWVLFLALIPLASDDFASRVSLLRPHVPALACFLMSLYAIKTRKPLICFLGSFLYALTYHALYVPLSLLAISTIFFRQKAILKTILAGFTGVVFGLISNPYFPNQLYSTRNSFRMALNLSGVPESDRPIEILPIATDDYLMHFGFYLLIIAFGWFKYRQLDNEAKNENLQTNFKILLFASSLFWFLGVYSRRAFEYAIPLSLILVPYLAQLVARPFRFQLTLGLLALSFNLKPALELYLRPVLPAYDVSQVLTAVQKLPSQIDSKVFNCEWANGPFILYQRPNLRFVDLTDPVLLNDHAPKDYQLRDRLKAGGITDVYDLVHRHFKSDYVLCEHPNIIAQIENDLRFQRLYPEILKPVSERPTGFTTLYAISK